jgi:hypothetical protein
MILMSIPILVYARSATAIHITITVAAATNNTALFKINST